MDKAFKKWWRVERDSGKLWEMLSGKPPIEYAEYIYSAGKKAGRASPPQSEAVGKILSLSREGLTILDNCDGFKNRSRLIDLITAIQNVVYNNL